VPDILIRGIDADAYARLKSRASLHGRSVNAEVRRILEHSVRPRLTREEWSEKTRALRSEIAADWEHRGMTPPSSVDLIREDRDR